MLDREHRLEGLTKARKPGSGCLSGESGIQASQVGCKALVPNCGGLAKGCIAADLLQVNQKLILQLQNLRSFAPLCTFSKRLVQNDRNFDRFKSTLLNLIN